MRVVKYCYKLPREVLNTPSLKTFKVFNRQGSELSDLVQVVPAHCRKWLVWMTFNADFQTKLFSGSWHEPENKWTLLLQETSSCVCHFSEASWQLKEAIKSSYGGC